MKRSHHTPARCSKLGEQIWVVTVLIVASLICLLLAQPACAETEKSAHPKTQVPIERMIADRQFTQAETVLVHALAMSPRDGKYVLMLAQVYFDEHRYADAQSMLYQANRLLGPTANGEVLAGLIDVVQNKLGASEERDRKAISLDPQNAPAHYYLGRCLYTRQSMAEAAEQYKTAISLDPTLIRAYDGLGLAYQALGARQEAERSFQEGMNQESKSPRRLSEWLPLDFATFLLESGPTEQVEHLLKMALLRNPDNAEVWYQLGKFNYQSKRYSDAVAMAQHALQLDPKSARAHYLCGRSYHALHQEAEAKAEFAKFHELSDGQSTNHP